jgi:hypothetical protein
LRLLRPRTAPALRAEIGASTADPPSHTTVLHSDDEATALNPSLDSGGAGYVLAVRPHSRAATRAMGWRHGTQGASLPAGGTDLSGQSSPDAPRVSVRPQNPLRLGRRRPWREWSGIGARGSGIKAWWRLLGAALSGSPGDGVGRDREKGVERHDGD